MAGEPQIFRHSQKNSHDVMGIYYDIIYIDISILKHYGKVWKPAEPY
jgi:hypothetical protein